MFRFAGGRGATRSGALPERGCQDQGGEKQRHEGERDQRREPETDRADDEHSENYSDDRSAEGQSYGKA